MTDLRPTFAAAVQLNVTVVDPSEAGYVTVYPCGERPGTSTVNFDAHQTVANAATAALNDDGEVCLYTTSETDLVVDYSGYLQTTLFRSMRPQRLFDTRIDGQLGPSAKVPGGHAVRVQVVGQSDIPADAAAVSLNLTVTDADAGGFVTAYPCGDRPLASNLNHPPMSAVPNAVVVGLDAGGGFCLFSTSTAHLLGDLNGWYPAGGGMRAMVERKVDTRVQCISGGVLHPGLRVGAVGLDLRWHTCGTTLSFVLQGASQAGQRIQALTLHFAELVPVPAGDLKAGCGRHVVNVSPLPGGGFGAQLARTSVCNPEPGAAADLGAVPVSLDASGALSVELPLELVRVWGHIMWGARLVDAGGGVVQVGRSGPENEAALLQQVPPIRPDGGQRFVHVDAADATAAIVNLTATGSTRGGYAVAASCHGEPWTSTVNYAAGETRANLAIVPLEVNARGQKGFCVSGTSTHMVVDLLGVLAPTGT
ncbi:MAG: hypothetical protein ACKV2O_09035 [Acidimicrobiales bacterium]